MADGVARLELAQLVSKQGRDPRSARLPGGPGLWRPRRGPPCSQLPLLGLRGLSRLPSQVVRLPGGVGPSLGSGPTSFPPQTSLTTWANMWPSAVALQGLGCRQPRERTGQGQGPWGPAAAGGSLLSVGLEGSGGVQPAWRRKEAFGRFCVRRGSAVKPQEESVGSSGWGRGAPGPREDSNGHGFWSWGIARAGLRTYRVTPLPSRKAHQDLVAQVPILQTRRRRLREVLPVGAGCLQRVGSGPDARWAGGGLRQR